MILRFSTARLVEGGNSKLVSVSRFEIVEDDRLLVDRLEDERGPVVQTIRLVHHFKVDYLTAAWTTNGGALGITNKWSTPVKRIVPS